MKLFLLHLLTDLEKKQFMRYCPLAACHNRVSKEALRCSTQNSKNNMKNIIEFF